MLQGMEEDENNNLKMPSDLEYDDEEESEAAFSDDEGSFPEDQDEDKPN